MTSRRKDNVWAVVVAAGSASRFGRPKLLERFRGEPLVRRALRAARHVAHGRVVLVTGFESRAIKAAADGLFDEEAFNPSFATGIGGSISAGVRHCKTRARAILLLLADQPFIDGAYLDRLLGLWTAEYADIVISRYGDTIGPPAIFSEETFCSLAALEADEGARTIVTSGNFVVRCMDEKIDNPDIDTAEDLLRYS